MKPKKLNTSNLLIVKERIKRFVKEKDMRISLSAIRKLSQAGEKEIEKAVEIAKEEGRTTILARDIVLGVEEKWKKYVITTMIWMVYVRLP